MGITQRLGEQVTLDTKFTDESGQKVEFGSVLRGHPVVVVPVFYSCQTGCAIIQDKIMKTLAKLDHSQRVVLGKDLDVVMISLHPKETPQLASSKKQLILNALEPPAGDIPAWRERASSGWRLLLGDEKTVKGFVTGELGFKYKYDAKKNLINHPTGTVFLTPEGKISAYTIGNDFPTKLVETDLDIAAKNEVAPKADQSMMFGCIMLDPETGRYRPVVLNILRVVCVISVIALAGFIVTMNLQSKRKAPFGGGDSELR